MAPSDLNLLIEMGFPADKAGLAVKKTGSLQDAIDWLDKNADRSVDEIKAAEAPSTADDEADPLAEGQVANSLQCKECGKKFRSNNEATFHANKSGHTDFEESTDEIKPLTAEERSARLSDLREKLAAKRAQLSQADKEDQKKNEEIRRKSTKEGQDIKDALQQKERVKEAEKKRAEKRADVEARKKILVQIEADKADRKRKAELERAKRRGETVSVEEEAPAPAPAAAPRTTASNATEARLRLQTPKGMLTKVFPAETTLFQVAQYVTEEQSFEPAEFIINFPRKSFTAIEFGLTLKEAGLTPSAALTVK